MKVTACKTTKSSKPGTAMVLGGGGMRNASTTGFLIGANVKPVDIDAIYCASSSIIVAVLFASGQLQDTIKLWTKYMTSNDVMWKVRGVLPRANMFRVAELCFNMIDMDAFEASNTKVFANVMCLDTGETESIQVTRDNFMRVVQTSPSLPVVTPKVWWPKSGMYYSDGAMHDNLPVLRAYKAGYRRILVVRNQPKTYVMEQAPLWKRWLSYPNYPKAREALADRPRMFNEALDFIASPPDGTEVVMMLPDETTPATQMVRDKNAVEAAIELGIQKGQKQLREVRDLLLRPY